MAQFAGTLLHNPIVERFRLIELFSVLRSILISVGVSLSGPARAVPKRGVHDVAGAIIKKGLSGSVEVGLVLDVLVDLDRILLRELSGRVARSEHRLWLLLWVNIASAERRLVWLVLCVVMWMGLWHCLGTVSPRGGVERIVRLGNPLGIESELKYRN